MRFEIPHPVPYQGSKRRLAATILDLVPEREIGRLVEPFAGSAAVTLAAAHRSRFASYLIADAVEPLVRIWQEVISDPTRLAKGYEALWYRERRNHVAEYYIIRSEFNADRDPAKLLYLLARCVKNSVRFNPSGEFNQSADKRRKGTHPRVMESELFAAHRTLAGKCESRHADFFSLFEEAEEGDFFYLDPPYQGTSEGRDQRYFEGVSRARVIEGIELLNKKNIPFILSYDGSCGEKAYGEPLPEHLGVRLSLAVGRSSQATLNGLNQVTVESLYVSHSIAHDRRAPALQVHRDRGLALQSELFAK